MGGCYSALVGLPLNITNCSSGFYCPHVQYNDSGTWPAICQPSVDCQIARLGSKYCAPQGLYEPQLCPPGYYCPDQFTMLPCPAGTYCIRGSSAPVDCSPLSHCPELTELRVFYGGLVIVLLLDLLVAALYMYGRFVFEPARARAKLAQVVARFRSDDGGGGYSPTHAGLDPSVSSDAGGYAMMDMQPGASSLKAAGATAALNAAFSRCNAGLKLHLRFSALGLTLPPPVARSILSGVTGEIHPGRVTAVMGPSGAGKTTFLSVLMGKVRRTRGRLYVNGARDEMHRYRQIIGFVPQEDTMLRELTVRENILFSARMRLPREGWSDSEVQDHVDAVIEVLGLSECAHTLIGDETSRGVSGGQRKRCNIGMELAVAPAALFLDEPTSGLDSAAALEVCRTLRSIADLGLTVVAVIHQPRAEIFGQIDDLLLLAPGGVTAYMGRREGALGYFGTLGFDMGACGGNPADDLLDFVAGKGPVGGTGLAPSASGRHLAALGGEAGAVAGPASSVQQVTAANSSLPATSAFFDAQWRNHAAAAAKAQVSPATSQAVTSEAHNDDDDDDDLLDSPYGPDDDGMSDSSSEGGYELAFEDSQLEGDGGTTGRKRALLGGVDRIRIGSIQLPGSVSLKGVRRAVKRVRRRAVAAVRAAIGSPGSQIAPPPAPGGSASPAAAELLSFGRGASFWRQAWLCTLRSLLQQYRAAATYALELGVCTVAGAVMGGAAAQLPELYNGVLKPPYVLLSPAPLETIVPSVGLYVALAIGLAGSPAGVLVFAEEKPVFWREAAAGHSRLAYYLAKTVSVLPRLTVGALHFTSVFHWWASPATSFTTMLSIVWLEFFCVYGLAACVSMLVKREQAPLLAVIASVTFGAMCGFGPSLAQARRNGFGWVLDLSYARWATEAWFHSETQPYRELFMVEEVSAPLFGFTLDRVPTDVALCVLLGLAMRVIAYGLLITVNRHKQSKMVMNKKIVVRDSGIAGKGLYVVEKIFKGEVCWEADADEQEKYWVPIEKIKTWPEDVQTLFMNNAYQVQPGIYSGVPPGVISDQSEYMNHSCEPNTVFVDDGKMIATRDVEVGEEITYEYATSESGTSSHMPFPCGCGTPSCRKQISGTDFLLPSLRAKYDGNFTSMIVELQKEADAKTA